MILVSKEDPFWGTDVWGFTIWRWGARDTAQLVTYTSRFVLSIIGTDDKVVLYFAENFSEVWKLVIKGKKNPYAANSTNFLSDISGELSAEWDGSELVDGNPVRELLPFVAFFRRFFLAALGWVQMPSASGGLSMCVHDRAQGCAKPITVGNSCLAGNWLPHNLELCCFKLRLCRFELLW